MRAQKVQDPGTSCIRGYFKLKEAHEEDKEDKLRATLVDSVVSTKVFVSDELP